MIIGNGTVDETTNALLLGVTEENIRELVAGRPMRLRRETHGDGIPAGWEIVIFYGKDVQGLYDQLRFAITPETVVHDEPRLGGQHGS